jgi:glycosyltransferase involved in cell wall biosynthesis
MRPVSPVSDAAWAVVHLQVGRDRLSSALPARPRPGGMMIVWWDDERVLGHRVVQPHETVVEPAFPISAIAGAGATAVERVTSGGAKSLSVIIPTRDRPEDLARVLDSLSLQSVEPDEIIVVDNAPTSDLTRRLVTRLGQIRARVRYVAEPKPGLDFARNAGIRASKSEVCAFCDDDVVLHRRWCEELLAAFDGPDVMAVTGLVLPLELATEAQRAFEFGWGFGRGYKRIDFGPAFFEETFSEGCPVWEIGAGASMAFRRTVFANIGLFDARLDAGAAGCSGDSEMWYRVLAKGWTCRYEPKVVSFHRHRREMDDLKRQIRAYLRGHVTALFVQFQRHRHWGNLRRVFAVLPKYYLVRFLRILKKGPATDPLLKEEVIGCLEGILYFARHWRPERTAGWPAGSPIHDG